MKKQPAPPSKKKIAFVKSMNGMNVGYSDRQPAPFSQAIRDHGEEGPSTISSP